MSRASDVLDRLTEGVPADRQVEATEAAKRTMAYAGAALEDALDDLGRSLGRALRLSSVARLMGRKP